MTGHPFQGKSFHVDWRISETLATSPPFIYSFCAHKNPLMTAFAALSEVVLWPYLSMNFFDCFKFFRNSDCGRLEAALSSCC